MEQIDALADKILQLPSGTCKSIALGVRKFVVEIPKEIVPTLEQRAEMTDLIIQRYKDLAHFYGFIYPKS